MTIRVGIVTPVLTRVPKAHAPWERDAGIEEVAAIAAAADRLGFDHLTCAEHVAVPEVDEAVRGATYWDPAATLGYLAAATTRIRLATSVVVLGYHHPLSIVKRFGTVDRLSGGRLVLGVGVGSLEAEFDLLGVPFAGRGDRADAAIDAIRSAWGVREVDGMVLDPVAPRTDVPVWVGGRTARSLRRAVEHGTGWMPFGLTVDEMATMLRRHDLPLGFDAVLGPPRALDPGGDPDGTAAALDALSAAGATIASVRLVSGSATHYAEQLEALATFTPLR